MIKNFKVWACTNPYIGYLAYGTIVYLKGHDNVVRQCKVIGGVFEKNDTIKYEYQIAGIKGHVFGTLTQTEIGAIYPTIEIAKYAPSKYSPCSVGEGVWAKLFNRVYPTQILTNKYGFTKESFQLSGTWSNYVSVRGISVNSDGTMPYKDVEMEMFFDKDGFHIIAPSIENGTLFANSQKAKQHVQVKVVTFDDVEDEEENDEEEKSIYIIRLTLTQCAKLKEFGIELTK